MIKRTKENFKNTTTGITMIALVVTIIVLLILASVSITLFIGKNSLIEQAKKAKLQTKIAEIKEVISIELIDINIEEQSTGIKLPISEINSIVYESLKNKNLTQDTKKVGNVLIISNEAAVFLTSTEQTSEATSDNWSYRIVGSQTDVEDTRYVLLDGYIGTQTNIKIPTYVKEDGVILPITTIGKNWDSNTFSSRNNIINLEILDNIETFEPFIFYGCNKLESVKISESVNNFIPGEEGEGHYFSNCSTLKTVTLPTKWERIPTGMFTDCFQLAAINFPDSLITIEKEAFMNCVSLKEIIMPRSVKTIQSKAFAFVGNDGNSYLGPEYKGVLERIVLNEGLETIGSEAFTYAQTVTEDLVIPSTVKSIGTDAFAFFGKNLIDKRENTK